MQPHPLAKFFGKKWLDLGKFGWIWGQNLAKIKTKFEKRRN